MEYDFEHYLLAGHGRAYLMAKQDPEKYRDRILEACRKDYTFDMQCEGSRAFFTADLVSIFEDKTPFIEAAQKAFDDPSTDTDLHQMQYLSDLLLEFGKRRSLIAKFEKMEKAIYKEDPDDLLDPFEYLAIRLMQSGREKSLGTVIGSIGRWFLSREGESVQTLKSDFLWFDSCAEERYGEDRFKTARENSKDPEAVDAYTKVMSCERESSWKKAENLTADEVISWIKADPLIGALSLRQKGLSGISQEELVKLAKCVQTETDMDVKAGIVSVFVTSRFLWPLDISILLDLSKSDHERLKAKACRALSFFKDERIRELGLERLKNGFDPDALELVIDNFKEEDEELVSGFLESIPITSDDESNWHGIVSAINKRQGNISLSILKWVYESSLCSWCREAVVEDMLEVWTFPEEYKEEVKWDANLDIRAMFEE